MYYGQPRNISLVPACASPQFRVSDGAIRVGKALRFMRALSALSRIQTIFPIVITLVA